MSRSWTENQQKAISARGEQVLISAAAGSGKTAVLTERVKRNPYSIVLLDEIGSGTDPIEGANLGISILNHLFKNNVLVLSTTHYPELKNYALVTDGFEKKLESVGVGYRFQLKGAELVVTAGYSHPVNVDIPEGIKLEVPSNTELFVRGIDKQLVGEFAANVRKIRKPEPYKGKGIRYADEHIRRKEGKKASK